MELQLEQLINSAKTGDVKAYEQLYRRYSGDIYLLAYSILKQPQDAEDAVQHTFIKVYLNLYQLSDPKAFEPWLKQIAVNECRMIMRKRHPDISLDTVSEEDLTEASDLEPELPHTFAEREELIARVREAIEALPFLQQEALTLQLYHHMSVEEIAYVTSSNTNTVKSRLYHARQKIKASLKEYLEGLDGVAVVPFGTVYLAVMQRDLKKKKPKNGWKQLYKLLKNDDGSIDSKIAALLPTSQKRGGFAVKLGVALLIGAVLTATFTAAISDLPGGDFGGRQTANNKTSPTGDPSTLAATTSNDNEPQPPAAREMQQEPPQQAVQGQPQQAAQNQPQQAVAMQEEQEQQVTPPVVTPTEAPETAPPAEPTAKPTAAPTQKPTEQSATPKSDAFGAYLQTLEKAQSELDLYNKSYGGSTRQIALSSLYGDNTPELLYLSRQVDTKVTTLNIVTYQDKKVKALNETYDVPVDTGFCFFIADGELYSCLTSQTAGKQEYRYNRYVDSSTLDYHYNTLQDVLVMHCNYNDGYHYSLSDSGEVSAEDFAAAEKSLLSRADTVVFVEKENRLPAAVRNLIAGHSPSAMTLASAKSYMTR